MPSSKQSRFCQRQGLLCSHEFRARISGTEAVHVPRPAPAGPRRRRRPWRGSPGRSGDGRGSGDATAAEPGLGYHASRAAQWPQRAWTMRRWLFSWKAACRSRHGRQACCWRESGGVAHRRPGEATPGRARLYAAASKKAQAALAAGEPVDPPGHDELPRTEPYSLLKLSKCGAARQIDLAVDLKYRLSKTLAAMQAGKDRPDPGPDHLRGHHWDVRRRCRGRGGYGAPGRRAADLRGAGHRRQQGRHAGRSGRRDKAAQARRKARACGTLGASTMEPERYPDGTCRPMTPSPRTRRSPS